MLSIIIALLILNIHASAGLHGALLAYPDGTEGDCSLEAFQVFMGKTTSPYDVSSREKTKDWWQKQCSHMLQESCELEYALLTMINEQHTWLINRFSCWPKLADLSEYDKLLHLNNDAPNAKPVRKIVSFMIIMSILHEFAALPSAPHKFTQEYVQNILIHSHENDVKLLNNFPENFQKLEINDMLFVANQQARYTKLQFAALFCEDLLFAIPSFLAGLYYGRLIIPVTHNFQNSPSIAAHSDNFVGMTQMLWHDLFLHGSALLVAEQVGHALFDQPEDTPFLQSWTQYAFKQLFAILENPKAHIKVAREFSAPRQCVCLASTYLAIFFNGLHEVPSHITNPLYLDKPFITADNELRDFNKTVFKDAVQDINVARDPKEEIRAYAIMPVNHKELKDPAALNRLCLKEWLGIEEDVCSFERMIQMLNAIKYFLASQHHKATNSALPLFNIPFNLVVLQDCSVSCALFNGLTAMLVHDSHIGITLLMPDPSALSHLTEHEARISFQSLRQVAFHFSQRSQSMFVKMRPTSFSSGSSFFSTVLQNANLQQTQERALLYADGALSPITYGIGAALCPDFDLQHFSSATAFQAFWKKCLHNTRRLSEGGTGDLKINWLDILPNLGKQYPAFPRIAQKESYNPPPQMHNGISKDLYRTLALVSVKEILAKYTNLGIIDENVLQRMERTLQNNPKSLQELLFLKNFPQSFATQDIQKALLIIEQLSVEADLEVYVVQTRDPTIPPLQFLAALHEGIILLPIQRYITLDMSQCSSHNGQYRGQKDIIINKEILGYLHAILHTERTAQYVYPDHPKPFLQHWVRERMANIQQNMTDKQGELFDMGQHLDPDKATAHATLAELLRLYQETHESTLLPSARIPNTPSALHDDNNFMILARSIFWPILGHQFSTPEQVHFIKNYLTCLSRNL